MLWATRRTRFLGILAIVCVFLVTLFSLSRHPESLRRFRQSDDSDSDAAALDKTNTTYLDDDDASLPTTTTFCQGDGCFRGAWTRRKHPFTRIEELKPWTGCPAGTQGPEQEQERADAKRLLEVMSWVWTPTSGMLKEWDAEAFVVRLLKTSGGLIVVGDEVSEQYFNSLVVLLRKSGITLDIGTSDYPNVVPYTLQASDGERLATAAGVPSSRTQRPLLTYIEDGFLLSKGDLKSIASRLGATDDYVNWKSPFPQAEGWPNYVREVATTAKGEYDTVLLMNTGIYWSREHFTILKPRNGPKDEQKRLTEAYRQMVRTLSNQLKDIGGLSIYYRATTPGHPNCAMRTSPYRNGKVAETFEDDVVGRLMRPVKTDAERELRQKWDWDLFSVHNDVWKRATLRLERERILTMQRPMHHGPRKKRMSRWHYLDIWSQALQRPDAHYEPGEDCLNWCSPAIFDQWTLHLHHQLQMETENDSNGSREAESA